MVSMRSASFRRLVTNDDDSWGSVAMKRFITCCALLGLVVLTACSGDSPSPRPLPTPAPDTWAISSLTVDNANPYINVGVYVTATVTKNGSAAPDGTAVEFIASNAITGNDTGFFVAYNSPRAQVATEGGSVTVLFAAETPGTRNIQVRVVDAVRQVSITYRDHDPSDTLQIVMPLLPNHGDRFGGEQVTLRGKGIVPPAEVTFILRSPVDGEVNGDEFEAVTVAVDPSEPLSADGSITIQTPEATTILDGTFQTTQGGQTVTVNRLCASYEVDITVEVGVGTSGYQTATYQEVFTYDEVADPICDPALQPECPVAPEIYLVVPDHGASAGGEQVTILGREFGTYWDDDAREFRIQTVDSVQVDFIAPGRTLRGVDPVVSPDGHQITVTTPRYGAVPLSDDVIADVKVTSLVERAQRCRDDDPELSDIKTEAFVFNADVPTPEILAVAPTAGPLDGGTVVTIFGHGFQFPLQVMFGNLEAIVNEVNDDTSVADNDTIICVTPDYSTQAVTPPVAVDVEVTNVNSGLNATLAGGFTYGANLFISGNTPTRGGRGTVVTIYGNGFEDPLQVDFLGAGTIRLETVAVSGTEVIVRFPDDETPECQDSTSGFRVTITDLPPEQGVVEGGSFTYLGMNPIVISVVPAIVEETLGGDGVSPSEITIYGQRFEENLLVKIGNNDGDPTNDSIIQAQDLEWVSDTIVVVHQLPAPNDLLLIWDTAACLAPGGAIGQQRVPTPVDVTVANIPGECSDTLPGGLVYEPEDTTCYVRVVPSVTVQGAFDATPHGLLSNVVDVVVSNPSGTAELVIDNFSLSGAFEFEGGGTTQGGVTLIANGTATLRVVFHPVENNNLSQNGTLVTFYIDPTVSYPAILETDFSGVELGVEIDGVLTLDVPAAGVTYTFDNLGDVANWTAATTGNFSVSPTSGGPMTVLTGSDTVTVVLTGAAGDLGTLTITATDPDNPGESDTLEVALTGI